MKTNRFYAVYENYADCSHLIGLGRSYEQAIEEPIDNGFEPNDMIVEEISETYYKELIDLYT